MPKIEVPQATVNVENYCTEIACNALLDAAKRHGLKLEPVMGLMYLPEQELTVQFQDACRAVLRRLSEKRL